MNWLQDVVKTKNYRKYIGSQDKYDEIGLLLFNLLLKYNLKCYHSLLDIGCGGLRAGKYFIPYLDYNRYFGIEPVKWLVDEALKNEINKKTLEIKNPCFSYNSDFNVNIFNRVYDFILANSIFIHASESQVRKCISSVKDVMHKDSVFLFNFIEGENNVKNEWSYPQSVTYRRDKIMNILIDNDLKFEFINQYYPGKQIWIKATK